LFQGKHGEYNDKPIELDLLPLTWIQAILCQTFSIQKAYQQVTKDEIT
jgi:hypothetical protein